MSVQQNRKPVQLERIGGKSSRDRVWEKIRLQPAGFSVRDVQHSLNGVSASLIRDYVTGLVAANYLSVVGAADFQPQRFTLIKDCGVDAPRLRKDGSEIMQGRGNENLWRTIKILKTFDWNTLTIAASTDEVIIKQETARHYVETLHKAGYLICLRTASAGVRAVYKLSSHKNTGAQPPMIQRGGHLYDPNLGRVVYTRGERHD